MAEVGLTQDTGWQAGASRTFPVDKATAWSVLVSSAGLAAWLGRLEELPTGKGEGYRQLCDADERVQVIQHLQTSLDRLSALLADGAA